MLSFVCTHIGEQDDLLLPHGPHRHSPPLPVKAGWRGAKPLLMRGISASIKAGASQRLMRIVRLAALIAPGVASREQSPPGYSYGEGSQAGLLAAMRCQHLQLKDGLRNLINVW